MSQHPHVTKIAEVYDGMACGNPLPLLSVLAPDVAWHFPGSSWMAGTQHGPNDVLRLFLNVGAMTDGTFKVEAIDIVGGDRHVASVVRASATREGRRFETPAVVVWTFEHGQVVDVREHVFEVAGLDEFWGDASPEGWERATAGAAVPLGR
jgi:ketosteroid isomerase-like protein